MTQSAFFNRYPRFQQNIGAPIDHEFGRLARQQHWPKYSTNWKVNRGECLQAEFEVHLGRIEMSGKLAAWQYLCQVIGIGGNMRSITMCKKVTRLD